MKTDPAPLERESFVSSCLEETFSSHRIANNRDGFERGNHDVIFTVKDASVNVEYIGPKLRRDLIDHRVGSVLRLIEWAVLRIDFPLDCRFILNPTDGMDEEEPPNRRISKIGFSAPHSPSALLIPDPHFLGYVGRKVEDLKAFLDKRDQAVFRGSNTSPQRVRVSHAALGNPFVDSKISNFVDWHEDDPRLAHISQDSVSGAWMTKHEQLEYKYILDMFGYTISWDRPCWVLPSNSILVCLKPSHTEAPQAHTWYSAFSYQNSIVPIINEKDLLSSSQLSRYDHLNPIQQEFGEMLLAPDTLFSFLSQFLLRYNEEFNS